MTTTTLTAPSEKQIAFIEKLAVERGTDIAFALSGATDRKTASATIEALLAMPKLTPAKAAPAPLVPVGFYQVDNVIYQVVQAKDSDRRYAKVLDGTKWRFVRGAIAKLADATPLTVEEAAAWGHRTGVCVCCGRILSNPESVTLGIGPICRKKYF